MQHTTKTIFHDFFHPIFKLKQAQGRRFPRIPHPVDLSPYHPKVRERFIWGENQTGPQCVCVFAWILIWRKRGPIVIRCGARFVFRLKLCCYRRLWYSQYVCVRVRWSKKAQVLSSSYPPLNGSESFFHQLPAFAVNVRHSVWLVCSQ